MSVRMIRRAFADGLAARRSMYLPVALIAACGNSSVPQVGGPAPSVDGFVCAEEPGLPCVERPALALVRPTGDGSGLDTLIVAGGSGELFRVARAAETVIAEPLGRVRGDVFTDLDRLQLCDPDGDGDHDLLFSTIDALDPGYLVFAPESDPQTFGKRTAARRHQAARCIDIDADGRDDLIGLISADEFGITYGQSWGLPDGIDTREVPSVRSDPADPEWLWQVVTSTAGDLDGDGHVEWLWAVRGRGVITPWSIDPDAAVVDTLDAVETTLDIDRIDLADLDGDGVLDLLVTGTDAEERGHLQALLGLGDATFGSPAALEFSEPVRRISFADIDDDGDQEVIAVGGWNEGVVAIDRTDDGLEIIASFPALANDAVALRFDEGPRWDLAILHADSWHVEVRRDAFLPARER